MKMSWRFVKGKHVISKGDGVLIALTSEQLFDMRDITQSIILGETTYNQDDNRKIVDQYETKE